jgi:hypothetical protein
MSRVRPLAGLLAASLAAFLAAGCAPTEAPAASGVTATDSSGIAIIAIAGDLNALPLAAPEPTVAMHGAPEDLFNGNPQPALALADGRLLLSDGRSAIGVYGADGAHTGTMARAGKGPGEFESVGPWWRTSGDSVWLADHSVRRLTLFAPNLTYVRDVPMLPSSNTGGVSVTAGLGGDTVAVMRFAYTDRRAQPPGRYTDDVELGVWTMGADSVGTMVRRRYNEGAIYPAGTTPEGWGPVPFGNYGTFVAYGRCTVYGFTDKWEFLVEAPGAGGALQTVAIVRAPGSAPTVVNDSIKEWYIRTTAAGFRSPPIAAQMERAMRDHAVFPATVSHFARVFASRDGLLWVQRYRGASVDVEDSWTVLDPGGRRAWRTKVPPRARLLAVDSARALVAVRDADDVETQHWWSVPATAGSSMLPVCRRN